VQRRLNRKTRKAVNIEGLWFHF